MKVNERADALIDLCVKYVDYLSAGGDGESGLALSKALENYGLPLHARALSTYLEMGDCVGALALPAPWAASACYLAKNPPQNAQALDVWFDPFELSFMMRSVNPPGFGRSTIGWISIGPVYYWQYHAFQQLVKYTKRDTYFPCKPDLLASRPFGVDESDYATDIYHAEASAYALWHGKWLTSGLRAEALVGALPEAQLSQVVLRNLYFWDTSPGEKEGDCSTFGLMSDFTIGRYSLGEWDRSKSIGFFTAISDQVGLLPDEAVPRDSGEYVELLNCSRKVLTGK
ncbi:hypothetical protein [Paludibacterium paludis]|uniref:Uncharacterized protein n=1 Tax=Paludibacterium paludis TaxID=1225769 RepID=A0A918P502_9NEIS|nr:hypothetical protein [Paludibacterium paludis]GGY23486.1 hypothetical protein GCM10011289_29130 [Paludibacterium paludis]